MKKILVLLIAGIVFSGCSPFNDNHFSWLEEGFRTPPDSTMPGVYWYWLNEHVSKTGITNDLEALRRIGISEVFIGNIFEGWMSPPGDLRTLSAEWEDCMRFALMEGHRIGIKISSFNCPGWSQAGGPWTQPEDAMRYLTFSEAVIEGDNATVSAHYLPQPAAFFQDVVVLAVPIAGEDTLHDQSVMRQVNLSRKDVNEPATIVFSFPYPVLKRSLVITPDQSNFQMSCDVYALYDTEYKRIASASFDRLSDNLAYGPVPLAPLCISLGETITQQFKVVFTGIPADFSVGKVELTSIAKVEHYAEKLNNKMPRINTPDWFAYQWETQMEPAAEATVDPDKIIVVSDFLQGDTLRWKAPTGRWHIMRLGMTPTLKTNTPAAPWAAGLEVDKMNRQSYQAHYDAYIGKISKDLPKNLNFNRVIADSYETGPSSWTDDFYELFKQTYHYDPLPWLALFSGQVIGTAEQSDRFMWDMRRLVADRIASEFVGGMAEVLQKNGTQLWLENYGWDGFPSEFLKYAKLSPSVGGEFWTTSPNVECRLAASACHIYNKNVVYAESYTTGNFHYQFHPGALKLKGDEAYTEGVNQHIIHLTIHQPYEDKSPGVNSWFGIELNRHNTWFEQSKAWIDYQRRCCYMLQQGKPAADVCFFIGEDCPKMAGWKDPALAAGYDYDFINADVIMNDMKVINGRLTLSSGISYSLLALPPLTTMRPELLEKIEQLVNEGAVITGMPVSKSPSLQGYPQCDEKVREIAARLWNKPDASYTNNYGKGKVFCNVPINKVLETIGTPEAVQVAKDVPVLWKQRDLPDGRKIFFLTNQSDKMITCNVTFRTTGYAPEWWNPVNGEFYPLTEYSVENGCTVVPLRFDAAESGFVMFREKKLPKHPQPVEKALYRLPDTWDIDFHNQWTSERYTFTQSPLFDWTQSSDNKIKYFSGTATYKTAFELPDAPSHAHDSKGPLSIRQLEFENIGVIATVYVNGQEAGTLWTKPYRLCIDSFLKQGKNELEIQVTNVWRNKIVDKLNNINPENNIFMLAYPSRDSYGTWLAPSGLWGDVKIITLE